MGMNCVRPRLARGRARRETVEVLALFRAGRPAPGRAPPRAIDYSCGLILFKSDGGYSKRPRLFKTPAAQAARFTFAGGSTTGSCSRSSFVWPGGRSYHSLMLAAIAAI